MTLTDTFKQSAFLEETEIDEAAKAATSALESISGRPLKG